MSALRDILPPFVVRVLKTFRGSPVKESSGEKGSEWYDQAFEDGDNQQAHYTKSPYYPITTVVLEKVRKSGNQSVLEIACGAGQLACALHDASLIETYCGFDFSAKRIEHARKNSPNLRFEIDDVFKTELFDSVDYNLVISTEFLEHVNSDLEVIERVKSGVHFIGTVPNYPWISHVRYFEDAGKVADRYGPQFHQFDVFQVLRKSTGQAIFVFEGIKK